MPARPVDPFSARGTFETGSGPATLYRLRALDDAGVTDTSRLPYSIRMVLEALLRTCDNYEVTEADVRALATWNAAKPAESEIPFKPARVVLQDFTGVPCVVDLAAMRAAMRRLGGDPRKINPLVPVDLVIDHSVQVDHFGTHQALEENIAIEFERNAERYAFLRWGQQAFRNFRVVPPAIGIVHQVNLEYLAGCVFLRDDPAASGTKKLPVAVPDTLVGTDSHTTMINGLGVVGWGVGGIEAEAVMLGQALSLLQLGECAQAVGDFTEADRQFTASLRLAQSVEQRVISLSAVRHLAEVDETRGRSADALAHLKHYLALRDSVFAQDAAQRVGAYESEMEVARAHKENAALQETTLAQEVTISRQRWAVGVTLLVLAVESTLVTLLVRATKAERRRSADLSTANANLEQLNGELRKAMAEVRTLSGLIPICSNCKRVRDDHGYWQAVETWVSRHSEAQFSHSICQSCGPTLYGSLWTSEGDAR
jgi:hypothetical protein